MPKKARELKALDAARIVTPGLHAVGGVAGLHLRVSESGARSWILRAVIGNKRRDIGLGGFPDVGLALARDKARDARSKIEQGVDPIAARKRNVIIFWQPTAPQKHIAARRRCRHSAGSRPGG